MTTYTIQTPAFVVDTIEPDVVWYPSYGVCPINTVENKEESDRCALCGKKISWRVIVQGADNKTYSVGQDCAQSILKLSKSEGVFSYRLKYAKDRARIQKQRTEAVEKLKEIAVDIRLASIPHPLASKKKQFATATMADYVNFWLSGAEKGSPKEVTKKDVERATWYAKEALSKLST